MSGINIITCDSNGDNERVLRQLDSIVGFLPKKGQQLTPYIIGLAGVNGAGKTHITTTIKHIFGERNISVIAFDSFYRPVKHLQNVDKAAIFENGLYDFESPYSIDHKYLVNIIEKYIDDFKYKKDESTINYPAYCFKTHTRLTDKHNILIVRPILVVEGIHALSYKSLSKYFSIKFHLVVSMSNAFIRRFADREKRKRTENSMINQWFNSVIHGGRGMISPSVLDANYIIPWDVYDVGILYELILVIIRDIIIEQQGSRELFLDTPTVKTLTENVMEGIAVMKSSRSFHEWHKISPMIILGHNTYLEVPDTLTSSEYPKDTIHKSFDCIYNLAHNSCHGKLTPEYHDYLEQNSTAIGKLYVKDARKEITTPIAVTKVSSIEASYEVIYEYKDLLDILLIPEHETIISKYIKPGNNGVTITPFDFAKARLRELIFSTDKIDAIRLSNLTRYSNLCRLCYVEYTDYNYIKEENHQKYSDFIADKKYLVPFSDSLKNNILDLGTKYIWSRDRLTQFIPTISSVYRNAIDQFE